MGVAKPTQVGSGMNFPVAKLIELLEPAQWEEFTEEWATSLKSYRDVERWSGPGDPTAGWPCTGAIPLT